MTSGAKISMFHFKHSSAHILLYIYLNYNYIAYNTCKMTVNAEMVMLLYQLPETFKCFVLRESSYRLYMILTVATSMIRYGETSKW